MLSRKRIFASGYGRCGCVCITLVFLQGLAAENAELKRQLEVLRKQVEDEAIVNTALHNQNQSLKEDYEFLKKTHEGVIFNQLCSN